MTKQYVGLLAVIFAAAIVSTNAAQLSAHPVPAIKSDKCDITLFEAAAAEATAAGVSAEYRRYTETEGRSMFTKLPRYHAAKDLPASGALKEAAEKAWKKLSPATQYKSSTVVAYDSRAATVYLVIYCVDPSSPFSAVVITADHTDQQGGTSFTKLPLGNCHTYWEKVTASLALEHPGVDIKYTREVESANEWYQDLKQAGRTPKDVKPHSTTAPILKAVTAAYNTIASGDDSGLRESMAILEEKPHRKTSGRLVLMTRCMDPSSPVVLLTFTPKSATMQRSSTK